MVGINKNNPNKVVFPPITGSNGHKYMSGTPCLHGAEVLKADRPSELILFEKTTYLLW